MCRRFEEWSSEIQKYCEENDLDFEKAKKMVKSWGKNNLMLLYYDPSMSKGLGLLDETPLPLALHIYKGENGELIFEQTEYTRKYLT